MMDGQLYLDQGDFAMAIIEFQEAQRIDPNVPSIYISLSECYWHLNKPERAMEYLDAALDIDPLNVEDIAKAIRWIIEHPTEAEHMGKNGRRAVEERYNWGTEEKKLLDLYEKILKLV